MYGTAQRGTSADLEAPHLLGRSLSGSVPGSTVDLLVILDFRFWIGFQVCAASDRNGLLKADS
jgi:hypothetical protein